MSENINPIKQKCMQIVESKPEYRKAEIAYLRFMMKEMDQETLMKDLETLNMKELRFALGAGVPGHAMHKANELMQAKKERMELFIEKEGNQAAYEAEYKNNSIVEEEVEVKKSINNNDSKEESSTE